MNVAIVHYHLNRGGVTQVIVNHLAALSAANDRPQPIRVVVFHGGRQQGWPTSLVASLANVQVTLHKIPELEYDTQCEVDSDRLATALLHALHQAGLQPEDTVVHIHNHALGKNVSLPGAVARLGQQGFGLLLQIHDFAEDFRPANYVRLMSQLSPGDPARLAQQLYWQSEAIHYAVLNGRDRGILAAAGIAAEQLHTLPNPVAEIDLSVSRVAARERLGSVLGIDDNHPYILYPIRAIRRKNLGEILLWATLCGPKTQFGVTLAPLNPVERPRYLFWKQLVERLRLPVHLETGAEGRLEFAENLVAADRIISTSVAEGFGMVFLETWLADRPLAGRDLPEITADFVQAGVELTGMSSTLNIPLDWICQESFVSELRCVYGHVLESYQRPFPDEHLFRREVSELFPAGLLDFARCSAKLQAEIIEQVAASQARREQIIALNPVVYEALTGHAQVGTDLVGQNANIVRSQYSLESAGQRLAAVYRSVQDSQRDEPQAIEHSTSILDTFLQLSRLHPIRIQ